MSAALHQALVLVVNAGSATLKFGLYPAEGPALWLGAYEGLEPGGRPELRLDGVRQPLDEGQGSGFGLALAHLMQTLSERGLAVSAVAHRIVHGGERFVAPCLLDEQALRDLHQYDSLAPLHQPHNLAGVAACAQAMPGVPQIGCFDTAFHASLPDVERRLPIDRELARQGLRRYGFHGLSYEYIVHRLTHIDPALARGRVIAAHLGNGASLCAIRDGRSIDTTMGFTALDGLMMGTRCGAIDPGVVLHLQTHRGMSAQAVEDMLYRQSGLLGVSGLSSDMRTLSDSTDPHAEEAISLFAWRAAKEAGALTASLGGLDGIVFTAGIGEHHADIRSRICRQLAWLGIELDESANSANQPVISTAGSRVTVRVIPTDEERIIALHIMNLLLGDAA